jgi:hypothetical protein
MATQNLAGGANFKFDIAATLTDISTSVQSVTPAGTAAEIDTTPIGTFDSRSLKGKRKWVYTVNYFANDTAPTIETGFSTAFNNTTGTTYTFAYQPYTGADWWTGESIITAYNPGTATGGDNVVLGNATVVATGTVTKTSVEPT